MRPLPTYREGRHGGGFLCFLLFLSVFLQILYVSLLQLSFQDLCRTDSQVLTGSLLIIIVCACLRHRSRITCDPRKQVPADDASIFLPELLRQLLDQRIMVCLWLPGLRPGISQKLSRHNGHAADAATHLPEPSQAAAKGRGDPCRRLPWAPPVLRKSPCRRLPPSLALHE